jgi:hypothetical protein
VLGNTLNPALMPARKFSENCSGPKIAIAYSERLTESGVMLRGPGVARCPEAV